MAAMQVGMQAYSRFGRGGGDDDHYARERAFQQRYGFSAPTGDLRRAIMGAESRRIRDFRKYRAWIRKTHPGVSVKRAAAAGWPAARCHRALSDPRTRVLWAQQHGIVRCPTREGAGIELASGPVAATHPRWARGGGSGFRGSSSSQQLATLFAALAQMIRSKQGQGDVPDGAYPGKPHLPQAPPGRVWV